MWFGPRTIVFCWPASGIDVRKALGKYGDYAESDLTAPYFKDLVSYHDFTQLVKDLSYHWGDAQ